MTSNSTDYPHPRRLAKAERESLDQRGKAIWDTIDNTRGGVWGPYSALMHCPQLAERVAALGEHLRFQAVLPDDKKELAILCAARAGECRFEWAVHEPLARQAGTRPEAIESLRTGESSRLEPEESIIIELVTSLINKKCLPESIFNKALDSFNQDEIIELVTIAGFYQLLAFVISAFDVPVPECEPGTF